MEGGEGLSGVVSARAVWGPQGRRRELGRVLEIAVLRRAEGAEEEERAWARRELGRGEGGFAGMFALGKAAFIRTGPAWCQHWYRMGAGGAEEQEACVWSCGLSFLLWAWGADSSLPPFAFLSRRDAGPRVCHGPWCQLSGCPGLGGWIGGAGLHLHLWLGQFSPWGASDYSSVSVAAEL